MALTYFETDGGKLAVEIQGEGPLIICSPAMGDTRDAYAPLIKDLVAAGYRVASMDLRGHGDSSTNFSRYGDEATADDYLMLINKLAEGRPAVLVGASLSGAAATIAAGREPTKVAGVILIGAFLRVGGGKWVMYLLRGMLLKPWGPALWQMYSVSLWPGLGDKAKERAVATIKMLNGRPGGWAAFQATVAGADHSLVEPWLGKASAPALAIYGEKDPDWSDPVAEAKWAASNFNDSEVITIPGVGHAPMLEKPEVVSPGVLAWLQKINFKA